MLADWYTTRTYGNNSWGDLLTQVGTNAITYDEIGNMTQHGAWKYEWEHGRELQKMIYNVGNDSNTANDLKWEFIYNADGLRTMRTDGTIKYENGTIVVENANKTYNYVYNGSSLSQMSIVTGTGDSATTTTLNFAYDASGSPMSVTYGSTTYYYVTNLQGDVVAILDSNGNTVVQYTYDAWGRLLSNEPTANSIGNLNPLRYRGYVYDPETGFYYVSSRYYDPEIGRWINADSVIAGTGGSIQGYNMFAYCLNNPVNMADYSGNWPQWVEDTWKAIKDFFSPDSNSTGVEFEDGIFRGSGSLTGGYSEVNGRLQVNSKNSKNNGMLGAFGKVSVGNASGKVGIGNNDVSLSFKGVGDGLTASAQAGIQYKNGAGLAAKAKAAVLSGRVTAELDLFGWQIEFGVSGDLLSVGAEAMIGVFPNEGFTAKASVGAGLFGAGFVFRVKPAQ